MEWMLKKVAALVLCATLALSGCGVFAAPDVRAAGGSAVYTFRNPDGPWPDLYAEHNKEVEQRKKERRKAERQEIMLEKAAMRKAAREARK